MGRTSFTDENGTKKGAWSGEEDNKLRAYVQRYGHWNWRQLPKFAGELTFPPLSLEKKDVAKEKGKKMLSLLNGTRKS